MLFACMFFRLHQICVFIYLLIIYFLQALHLIGQALLEEKNLLEACSVEEVTFDFSIKSRSMYTCHWGGNGGSTACSVHALHTFSSPHFLLEVGADHGKSLFHFLSKMKLLPSLEAHNDMINWTLQV